MDSIEPRLFPKTIAREKLNLPEDIFIFGNVGRLVKNKDQKTLIQAYARIQQQCPHSKLILMGTGVLEAELKNLSSSLGLENKVIFAGFVPDAVNFAKAFDVLVSLFIQEAFGMVLIEAMTAKVPVINPVDGVPEVINNSGLLVEPNDPLKLSEAMFSAYQMKADSLKQWGEQGYLRVKENFSTNSFKKDFQINLKN